MNVTEAKPHPSRAPTHRRPPHRSAIVVTLLTLAVVILVAVPAGREAVRVIDVAVYDYIQDRRSPLLRAIALAFDVAGSWFVTWPLRIGVAAWLANRRRWIALWAWVGMTVISEAAIGLVKDGVARPRPDDLRVAVTAFSFPSGHAVAATVIGLGLVLILMHPGGRRRAAAAAAIGAAFLMAATRLYLNAHWLSDVVAGVGIGAAVAIGTVAVADHVRLRRVGERALSDASP